ncbi:HD-GYP domain-containing protein [Pseudodesulfovibrio pelocollis]|uniref:HD-GYP domain-containing protein n=1 Tax=Pseudodesulfovibrio pelocollis TaxID=3051432 RepID=UPI00255AF4D0|nr:HD-GYP domain-containing protein [Pseudodesulfovibrio sp. SB368]
MPKKTKIELPYSVRVEDLEVGMYIRLPMTGWMDHPFLRSKFLLRTDEQIAILMRSGVSEVQVDPLKSKLMPRKSAARSVQTSQQPSDSLKRKIDELWKSKKRIQSKVETRRKQFSRCLESHVHRISMANELEKMILAQAPSDSIQAYIDSQWENQPETSDQTNINISIINNTSSSLPYHHGANTAVLSIILALELGYEMDELKSLMFGALLHDIGLEALPQGLRIYKEKRQKSENRARNAHIKLGVELLKKAKVLDEEMLKVVEQHHEHINGMGFLGLKGDSISEFAQIVAICNHYDRHINNPVVTEKRTPHRTIVDMFNLFRERFNNEKLNKFIYTMGIYPAGSIVKLNDGNMGMITGTFPDDMKNPEILLYDPDLDPRDALFFRIKELGDSVEIKEDIIPHTIPLSIRSYLNYTESLNYSPF